MGVFPTLATRQDSSKFTLSLENPAMRAETDGGYVYTRRRHTRTPRKTFKVGYTSMGAADKLSLESFYNSMGGGSDMFTWTNDQDGATYTVRFKEALEFSYIGMGDTQLWNCAITFEEV